MIRIEQTNKAFRKLFPLDEYCINKNGEYIYLTKVELMKIVCDLKLLGIADVVGQSELLIAYTNKLNSGDYNYIQEDSLKVDTFLSNL
jgi:hypothetical protein